MTTSSLTSLAILKVNWDYQGSDYIENFVPFVVETARLGAHEVISLPEMQRALSDDFGLRLPLNALRMIIVRAAKRGYFRRDSGVFYRVKERCDESNFREAKSAVAATHDRVLKELRNYAETIHDKEWSNDDTENVLLDFLADQSLGLLFDIAEGAARSPVSEGDKFVVGSFIEFARIERPEIVDDIALLAKGNLLANAMFLPDPGRIAKKFRRTTVFFDTSFIMFAAGFGGPDRAAPCLELLELLSQYGAELRCFSDTRNEVQGVIDACASRLQRGELRDAYGPTIEYFVEAGKTASDLELMSARLPGKLTELGVRIVDRPNFDRAEFQVDEKGFEEYLRDQMGYTNPNAVIHDVDCISAIARIRKGVETHHVEESRALFITTNTGLARATRQYFQPDSAPGAVALAVTDFAIANLLWLENPTAAPDLPRKWVVAEAYAAMQPPAGLWKKYLAEIARLQDSGDVSADEYLLLRHSLASKAALMDLTDGSEDGFTEGSVKDILDVAKENVRADLKAEVENQRQRRRNVEEELRAAEEASLAQRQKLRARASLSARFISSIVFIVAFLSLLYAVVVSFPYDLPSLSAEWLAYAKPVVLALLASLTLGNLIMGTTVHSIVADMERRLAELFERAFFWLAGIETQSPLASQESHD